MFPSFCVALFLGFAFSVYAETYMGYVVAKEQSPDDRQQFENAEIRAQAERVGLWSEKIRIPPEMWRRGYEPPSSRATITPNYATQSRHVLMGTLTGIKQKRPEMAVFL